MFHITSRLTATGVLHFKLSILRVRLPAPFYHIIFCVQNKDLILLTNDMLPQLLLTYCMTNKVSTIVLLLLLYVVNGEQFADKQ